jgi:broad specificity phosphatase PhoE
MSVLRYITHPNVVVDPDVAVTRWKLSPLGRDRLSIALTQPWVGTLGRIVSSGERKAVETATAIADHLGVEVEIRRRTGEVDRSATGYVPHELHEQLADQFFGSPHDSAQGWERAVDARDRIVTELSDLMADEPHDTAVVGHGAVGTLLLCHLSDVAISRTLDQPGQGHFWAFDRSSGQVVHRWRPIDDVPRAPTDR